MTFSSLINLFDDMKKHNHRNFLRTDDPMRLMIGWTCLETEKTWEIRIKEAAWSIHKCPDEVRKTISDIITKHYNISSTDFNNFLDNSQELERYLKLKAFW